MQKHKHIKYTKLSPIMLKTIPFPSGVAILSHVGNPARHRLAIFRSVLLIWFFGVAT